MATRKKNKDFSLKRYLKLLKVSFSVVLLFVALVFHASIAEFVSAVYFHGEYEKASPVKNLNIKQGGLGEMAQKESPSDVAAVCQKLNDDNIEVIKHLQETLNKEEDLHDQQWRNESAAAWREQMIKLLENQISSALLVSMLSQEVCVLQLSWLLADGS